MRILAGSASTSLGRELSRYMGVKSVEVEERMFPDGEVYVRLLDDVRGQDAVLVQSTHPNEKVVEFFLLQDALKEAGVRSITAVIPYFGYGRQDRRFKEGEAVSARAMAKRIQVDADALVTVDLHNERVASYFSIPVRHVSGAPALAEYLAHQGIDLVLAPDTNASRLAGAVAQVTGTPWDYLEKQRLDGWTVETKAKALDVKSKRVAIVDDVISTGGTIANAAKILKDQGARQVLAACIHGVFAQGALDRLRICDAVVATDTLLSPVARVSVARQVASVLPSKV